MSANNVANFAAELKMPADVLLQQLKAAGVAKRLIRIRHRGRADRLADVPCGRVG